MLANCATLRCAAVVAEPSSGYRNPQRNSRQQRYMPDSRKGTDPLPVSPDPKIAADSKLPRRIRMDASRYHQSTKASFTHSTIHAAR